MSNNKETQRLAVPNWKPCTVTARAVCVAMSTLVGEATPAAVRSSVASAAASVAVTQPLPVLW